MSRLFSSLQRLEIASALITAYPFTIACWAYDDGTSTIFPFLVGCSTSGTTAAGTRLQLFLSDTGVVSAGISSASAAATVARSTNTWFHACGVYASTTSRAAFLNGGNKGTNTTSITFPSGMNRTSINAWNGGANVGIAGNIAHVGIWNVALTDQEVLSLANGLSPLRCRPQSLIDYWPLAASYTDETGVRGNVMTNYSSVAGSIEPSVRRPVLSREILLDSIITPFTSTDTATLSDALIESSFRNRAASESASLADALIESSFRNRAAFESSTLSDVLITSRLRGRLSSEGSTIDDALSQSSFRNRASMEGATLADSALESSFRNRTSSDAVESVADEILRSARRSRLASDGIAALDEALRSILRTRLVGDSSTLIDQFISTVTTSGPTIYAFTATETLVLIDLAIEQLSLSRVSSDALVAEDALILSALRRRILSEAATATDESLRQVTRNRILIDAAILVDASATSTQRNRTSTESASILDEDLTARQANRTASESLNVAEVVSRSLSRAIFTSDLVTVADATLLIRQISAQVSEALSISEIIAKSLILSSYFDVRVLLGTLARNSETVLGSSESILLSASDGPTLGSYS